jgi:hypothetical protein
MGEQVKELFNWARRRKILATLFVVLTLGVGILIVRWFPAAFRQ